ncbi:hypothetical protein DVH24_038855 [Malus domestica]|uniref:Uncharacterized protein n=1 Tax=Malus domestica TaxID=3750 RepID=A0A498KAW7_MALDO|nr:hypothetical protein DVH24_038855 [Malus domestica]
MQKGLANPGSRPTLLAVFFDLLTWLVVVKVHLKIRSLKLLLLQCGALLLLQCGASLLLQLDDLEDLTVRLRDDDGLMSDNDCSGITGRVELMVTITMMNTVDAQNRRSLGTT